MRGLCVALLVMACSKQDEQPAQSAQKPTPATAPVAVADTDCKQAWQALEKLEQPIAKAVQNVDDANRQAFCNDLKLAVVEGVTATVTTRGFGPITAELRTLTEQCRSTPAETTEQAIHAYLKKAAGQVAAMCPDDDKK